VKADKDARTRNLPAIDGLRGVAALMILFTHIPLFMLAQGPARGVMVSSYIGVDLFFVISGFVLFLPVVFDEGRFEGKKGYFIRRAGRIVPAYYFSLLVVVAFSSRLTTIRVALPQNSWKGVFDFVAHLSFFQHEMFWVNEGFGVNSVLWTLSVEALFYLCLPLIAVWYYRRPFLGLTIALAGGFAWKLFATHPGFLVPWGEGTLKSTRIFLAFQAPTYLGHFAMGMTAAWVYHRLKSTGAQKSMVRLAPMVQVAALLGLLYQMHAAGSRQLAGKEQLLQHATKTTGRAACFAIFLLATVLGPKWSQWPLANRFARWMGEISYGVYLYHILIIGFAFTTLGFAAYSTPATVLKMLIFAGPATILVAWASHIAIERPVYVRARALSRRVERRSVVSTGPPEILQVDAV